MNSNQEQNNEDFVDLKKTSTEEIKIDDQSIKIEDKYKFGWSSYSEITNGRFAMIGFIAAVGAYAVTGQLIPGFWHEQLIACLSLPSIRKVVSPTWCHAKQGQTTY